MGQAASRHAAVVVEPSDRLRGLVGILLEETGYRVHETAQIDGVLDILRRERDVSLLFVDLPPRELAGLARTISAMWPDVRLIVPCASRDEAEALPQTAFPMSAPWRPLDVLIQAERARQSTLH